MFRQTGRTWLAVALGVMLALAAACGDDGESANEDQAFNDNPTPIPVATTPPFPVSVIRSDGREFTLAQPADRIVSLSPGATESLFAIGAGETVVGVSSDSDTPAEARALPQIDAAAPDVAAIQALSPDMVVVAADTGGIVRALDDAGIPVLYIDTDRDVRRLDAVYGQMGLLGRIAGVEAQATEIVNDLRTRANLVELGLIGLPNTRGPRLYYELDPSFRTVSDDTITGYIFRLLKARNIAEGSEELRPQLAADQILADNPEVILVGENPGDASIDAVRARPGWANTDAVRDGRVFAIDDAIISRPGPRLIDAMEFLARQIYPQAFQ